ncbi:MAG: glycoside hydrolase family 5 protein [Lachnospiraceae bacterium]|nr:glycoside hydrolase family 5 protein [Lachnospiraceae bacterium]
MKKFKRILSLSLAVALVAGCFAACGKKEPAKDVTAGAKYKELNAIEFTKEMGNGINLGNTMEAYGHASYGTSSAVSVYETAWGMPVTTKEMIQGMKDAGFDSIRIPVAWTNMMNYESGDYTINEAYIKRVGEIITWAIEADMIVVVNDHWDGGWWAMFGSEDQATKDKAMALFTSMWTQLVEAYKDFDYHLVFESANEEMGDRFNDKLNNVAGKLTKDECYELANTLNQKFVDIVRASSGYNKDRFLLLAGYNTDIAHTCDDRYKMPKDTAEGKLIVSVHYYTPSSYCIEDGITNWGTKADFDTMNGDLAKMEKFTKAGYGVIIGEYGVLIEGQSELKADTVTYLSNFLANCDLYGYCPMLWDCNSQFNRKEAKMAFEEVADLYLKNCYSTSEMTDEDVIGKANQTMKKLYSTAPEGEIIPDDQARAWIMINSSDYGVTYRVGDAYPDGQTAGLVATDVDVTGAGTYTVSLDFTGTGTGKAVGMAFSAVAILHGETLFPGYYMEIKEIKINGEAVEYGKGYTTSDDKITTRVNLYNGWVTEVPEGARRADGDLSNATAMILDGPNLGDMTTLEVTFEYVAP